MRIGDLAWKNASSKARCTALVIADILGLAVILATADAVIHMGVSTLLETPPESGISLSWLILIYSAIVFVVALVFRSRPATAAIILMFTILAQGGFLIYRSPSGLGGAPICPAAT